MPARTEPVIDDHRRASWCSTIARPVSRSPQITLNTPGGRNSAAISASSVVAGRRRVARLEHDRVAGGDRRGELPDRHHHRVVPRRDLGAHADRLAADERRHVRPCTRRRSCPRGGGRRRRRSGSGRPSAGSPPSGSRRDRLAGVLDLERDQLVGAGLDRVGDAEQRQRALATAWCRASPRTPSAAACIAASTSAGPRQRRRRRTARRSTGLTTARRAPVGRVDALAVDEVRERLHGRSIMAPVRRGRSAPADGRSADASTA